MQNVNKTRPLQYQEVNVMEPGQERWKDVYEFDTPVVSQQHTYTNISRVPKWSCSDPHRQSKRARDNNLIA